MFRFPARMSAGSVRERTAIPLYELLGGGTDPAGHAHDGDTYGQVH
jgi:hypothetical protein